MAQAQERSWLRRPVDAVFRRLVRTPYFRSLMEKLLPEIVGNIHLASPTLGVQAGLGTDELFQTSVWVYRAASIWASLMSQVEMQVVDENGKRVGNEKVVDALLAEPNPDFPASEIWYRWGVEMALRGHEGFEVVYKGSTPVELWPVQPNDFRVIPSERERIYHRPAGYHVKKLGVADYSLTLDEFIHWRFYNPFDPYYGLSPIRALQYAGTNDVLASAWHYHIFQNGAMPGLAIVGPAMTRSEREAYELALQEQYGLSVRGWGVRRPLVLEKGVTDLKEFGYKAQDMEWKSLREFNRDDIAGAYGIPDEIMGFGKNTYENFDMAQQVFWTDTALPLLNFRDVRFTHWCRRRGILAKGHFVRSNTRNVVPLRRVLDPLYNQSTKLFAMGVPFAEINEYFSFGLSRFAGDENSYLFGTSTSIDKDGNVLGENQELQRENKIFARMLDALRAEEKSVGARNGCSTSGESGWNGATVSGAAAGVVHA